jgi:hypothetical protein
MMNTQTFATTIGRQKMAAALHVLPTAVSNAVVRGTFPPSWYETCRGLAAEAGITCPPYLFNQRPHGSPTVDSETIIQGAPAQKVAQ